MSPQHARSRGESLQSDRKRILIVDDEEIVRNVLEAFLPEASYDVSSAKDGREAMYALSRERFDLVITDMLMPDVDGFELMNFRLCSNSECKFIMITGIPTEEAKDRARSLGAATIIAKPFTMDEIREAVRNTLDG